MTGEMHDKAALRARFRALRAQATPESAQAAAEKIAALATPFLAALRQQAGLSAEQTPIALYAALPGELDCAPLLRRLADENYPTLLPVAGAKATPLVFRLWRPGDALIAGRFGLREPLSETAELTPKILLAPLLAFDDLGGRLGFGGGYYDATLAALRAGQEFLAAGGLAYARQQAAKIPMESHDARLDFVVTEEKLLPPTDSSCGYSSSAT